MRDAKQCGVPPDVTGPAQQGTAQRPVQPAERLIEDDEPRSRARQAPAETHPLPLPAGEASSALAQWSLESIGEASEHVVEVGLAEHVAESRRAIIGCAIEKIVEERAVPEPNRRIDPGCLGAQPPQPRNAERLAIDQDPTGCGTMPPQQQPD